MFSNLIVIDLLKYIDENLYAPISIQELSILFHYNKDYLMRIFKREIGLTIIDYINQKRIYNSLFSYSFNRSIMNISLSFGFSSLEYYSEVFKRYMGVSPRIYLKYVRFGKSVSNREIDLIQKNLTSLELFFSNVSKYEKNIPPSDSVISLSIFKKKTL